MGCDFNLDYSISVANACWRGPSCPHLQLMCSAPPRGLLLFRMSVGGKLSWGTENHKRGIGFFISRWGQNYFGALRMQGGQGFWGIYLWEPAFFFLLGGSLAAGPNAPCNFGILPKGVEIWLLGRRLGARRRSNHFWDFLEIFLIPKSLKPLASSCGNSYISFW